MKTQKSLVKLLAIMATAALCLTARADNSVSYINAGTNTVLVGVSNMVTSVVLPNSTNYFNISTTLNAQPNTNLWPACPLVVDHNTFAPSRWLTWQDQFNCGGANSGIFVERFAGSTDGSHWQTNPCPVVITMTANGTGYVQTYTNYDSAGFQYFGLFSEENTNTSTFITNHWLGAGYNRGL